MSVPVQPKSDVCFLVFAIVSDIKLDEMSAPAQLKSLI